MSMTFHSNIDYTNISKIKIYMKDLYPDLDDWAFESDGTLKEEETGLYYEWSYPEFDFVHEMNLANSNMLDMLGVIDSNYHNQCLENDYWIVFSVEDLPNLKRKIIKAINSSKSNNHVREPSNQGNMYYSGMSKEYISKRLAIMLEIVDNAQKRNLSISCG